MPNCQAKPGRPSASTLALWGPATYHHPHVVGMTVPEIAAALDLATRTVDRHWAFARAWLKRTIRTSLSGPAGSV